MCGGFTQSITVNATTPKLRFTYISTATLKAFAYRLKHNYNGLKT